MAAGPTLRLTQTSTPGGQHQVQVALDGAGRPQTASAHFAFQLTDQDRENLRWYLEDYLVYPIDPAPTIAGQVEQRMAEVGRELFTKIFDSREGWSVWDKIHDRLHQARIEVVSDVESVAVLPWELLRDPRTDNPLALDAHTFVRAEHETAKHPELGMPGGERIRVLLVICRPAGSRDVPFRSVASHLVRLSGQARDTFQLDVLRPPTFKQLAAALRTAADQGEPYHVVHFDGHGTWANFGQTDGGSAGRLSSLRYPLLSPARPGLHGYLLFEDPGSRGNQQLVDGPALGRLLVGTGVPVLVLNACRSAHADLAPEPQTVAANADTHARVRAYGSLAQEVVDQGVPGVVAMRYSVYVVTAAQFTADLYAALLQGLPLGTAVSRGRSQLAEQPNREIAFAPRPLQDWVVPVVYEAVPLELFAKPQTDQQLVISLDQTQAAQERAQVDPGLPAGPEVGFYGRDETLLALDRAFDQHSVVLLHAFAGAGKTSTAVEFARWYQHTGGVQGLVLFASFEHHLPLSRVLDQLGAALEQPLEQAGIYWLTLDEVQRRQVALDVLKQVPVLWIWDNIEPVHGFPEGSRSDWTYGEQQELVGFLNAVKQTRARVLLTSRRDEFVWLGELPARVQLPQMPMAERVQLSRAIADRYGRRLAEVEDWRPLLTYTQGNPLTVTVLVGQALRSGIRTRTQVERFVEQLRAGEAHLEDQQWQGRTRSLGASLAYGFETAFSEAERTQLALLHLFQATVDVDTLRWMGAPEVAADAAISALAGLSHEAGIALLDRASEVGLLTRLGEGFYTIHPALPWYFAELFNHYHGHPDSPEAATARRAYTCAISQLGDYLHNLVSEGREIGGILQVEEANLLHALDLARANGWWDTVLGSMQGLRVLYEGTGRWVEWGRLVNAVAPELVDLATDKPLPGREEEWSLITEYRVRLTGRARDFPTATRLQRALVASNRPPAALALATDPAARNANQQHQIRTLAVVLSGLGNLLREQMQPTCTEAYIEALELFKQVDDRHGEATCAFNLGNAYEEITELRDLDEAERWYQLSLSLREQHDVLGQSRSLSVLGYVQMERYKEAASAGRPRSELLSQLQAALDTYTKSLELIPREAVDDLAVAHNQLAMVLKEAGQFEPAMGHYRDAVRYLEAAGNLYRAAIARRNVAVFLAERGRPDEALPWARAALDGLQAVGPGAATEITETKRLLALIEQDSTSGTSNLA
jgi:tetratricopeptide (TPR) repeat protein